MRAAKFSCAHPTGRADSERIDTANAIDIGAILTSELVSFEFSAQRDKLAAPIRSPRHSRRKRSGPAIGLCVLYRQKLIEPEVWLLESACPLPLAAPASRRAYAYVCS